MKLNMKNSESDRPSSGYSLVYGPIVSLMYVFVFLWPILMFSQTSLEQPNIILITCDQMRADAMGFAGNPDIRTPHLDYIAKNGVIFRQNYANSPVCLPSRVSIFSGLYPHQTGILNNKPTQGNRFTFRQSLPWYLKQAGYKTAYIGKNHTFPTSELDSFDLAIIRDREVFRAYSKYVPPYWHSDILWPEEDCNPRKNTADAINFIRDNVGDQPFFLSVNYFDPHPPYMAPAEFTSQYCAEELKLPEYIDPDLLSSRLANHQKALQYDRLGLPDLKETLRYYYAAIEWGVDQQIGMILNVLNKVGISDKTVIVFTADHGDFMGQHHMVRKGMFLYDALLRVPNIWYGPGVIGKGISVDQPSQNVDIFPTLLNLAGINVPEQMSGRILTSELRNENVESHKKIAVFASATYSELPNNYWSHPEPYYDPNSNTPFHTRVQNLTWKDQYNTAMIRVGEWKLIISETQPPELYRLLNGSFERENVYEKDEYEDIAENLHQQLKKIWKW